MELEPKVAALIAIGASVNANCQPCLQYHLNHAKECGADDDEINSAIKIAKKVRMGGKINMDEFISNLNKDSNKSESNDNKKSCCE